MIDDGDDKENLLRVCRALGLPDDVIDGIQAAALALRNFESNQGVFLMTVAQRRRGLDTVTELAEKLSAVVQELNCVDRQRIDDEFGASPLRLSLEPPDPLEAVLGGMVQSNVLRIGDVLLTLASITRAQSGSLPVADKGGRPPVAGWYAHHLTAVARLAYLCGITPGRGGKFSELCAAVFCAAGVKTDPDNAIRRFVDQLYPMWKPVWDRERAEQEREDNEQAAAKVARTPPKSER